ncbi:hypothetical protein ACFSFW_14650 [Fredinandcohnia salidurans]|uniref:Uncharacterized protein n=1 Tax=Fredinandcohnia salidurans TaxID=2595041 RepID=A0ABW4MQG0_9BACI
MPLKEELKFLEFLAAATGQVADAPAGSQVSRFSRWSRHPTLQSTWFAIY